MQMVNNQPIARSFVPLGICFGMISVVPPSRVKKRDKANDGWRSKDRT
jgi:hypothetical protein